MADLTAAMAEAYACAPANQVILHTLELVHPDFKDSLGRAAPIRVVNDSDNLTATLETGARATFIALAFGLKPPDIDGGSQPKIEIQMDNVGREIMPHLRNARASQTLIKVVYRAFLSNLLDAGPQVTPIRMVLSRVRATLTTITAEARMADFANKKFPNELYTLDNFIGLSR